MSQSVDEDEHSLEMHLPYIYKILSRYVHCQHASVPLRVLTCSRAFGDDPGRFPKLVPIMVGNTNPSTEMALGRILATYLSDPSTAFVISSDFAHWGIRFRYTFYRPAGCPGEQLSASAKPPIDPPIHESIKRVDFESMGACESGNHFEWLESLEGEFFCRSYLSIQC